MGAWSSHSKTEVAHMEDGDFYGSEQSVTVNEATQFAIEFTDESGTTTVLKPASPLKAGEIIDSSVMNLNALKHLPKRNCRCESKGILLSVHLKATMMKVSDPIIFSAIVEVYFEDLFKNMLIYSKN